MNVSRVLIVAALLALTGCATCREHPTACTAVAVVAASAIAASLYRSCATDYRYRSICTEGCR